MKDAPPDDTPARRGDAPLAISTVIGVAAAVVLAMLLNGIAARHFRRWDVTTDGVYTLTSATRETLHQLEEPLVIHVLLPEGDALRESLDQLLLQYRAETQRLDVRETDPDRSPAEFMAVQQKYGIVAGRTEGGQVITDAAVVIVRADQPTFLTPDDLVEADGTDGIHVRPRLEEALTGGIRRALSGERPHACFTEGHGERSVDVAGEDGLGLLRDRLVKNNYEVTAVWTEAGESPAPLAGCDLVIVAGPTVPLPQGHVDALRGFIEGGGDALFVVGPVPRDDDRGYVELGDAPLMALAGVRREADFIFEMDPARRATHGFGETFLPRVAEHAATAGLRPSRPGADVVVTVASSLTDLGGPLAPQRLLETSEEAFGMTNFFAWAKEPAEPTRRPEDLAGPLNLAMAVERPKAPGQERGARIVVVSTASILSQANWQKPELHATATFVESCISWLASHRAFLDLPTKTSSAGSLEITAEALSTVFRSAVVLLPGAAALAGVLVWLRRRREVTAPGRAAPKRDDG